MDSDSAAFGAGGKLSTSYMNGCTIASAPASLFDVLNNAKAVSVDAGATLAAEGDVTIPGLAVDLSAGCGTISNFTFAATGTVYLENIPEQFQSASLDWTLQECDGVANLASWKVAVDGVKIKDAFMTTGDVIWNAAESGPGTHTLTHTCDGETPHTVELYADKAGPVTGANIREDGIVTVLNKDQIICTLDTDRQFEMHLELDRGKGYRPSELNKRDDQPIGTIPVDCLFSPIERVSYDVQACRVGSNTDYDRLELTVWADGRIDPRDAVKKAARILTDHLAVFVGDAKESGLGNAPADIPEFDEESLDKIQKLCQGVDTLPQ